LGSKFVEAGEMLHVAEAFIDKNYHPTVICRGNVTSAYGSSFLLVANHFLLMICASFI
jgi:T-complex protein 1 subunit gamma